MGEFHFIRPEWLLALIPLLGLLWYLQRPDKPPGQWKALCDEHLLPYLLGGEGDRKRRWRSSLLFGLVGTCLLVALAGPAWERLPQPVYRDSSALVIALDLSRSMDATDIKPSRLARARHKVQDILQGRREGQTALLVYAAQPFVVTPLTEDTQTISAHLHSLTTELMPSQGSRADLALEMALQLLQQSGALAGDLLFITDGLAPERMEPLLERLPESIRVHVLGVGSEQGAPIPLVGGGFLKDPQGDIVVAQMEARELSRIARAGGGRFARLTADDADLRRLFQPLADRVDARQVTDGNLNHQQWREEGPWLLLFLLPLVALGFRRGYLFLLFPLLLPLPREAAALSWDQFWLNSDQQAQQALLAGDAARAATLFSDPRWRSAAYYRSGEYAKSLDLLEGATTADDHYNRANALVRQGELEAALAAYQQAMQLNPNDADARYNHDLVKDALASQQQASDQSAAPSSARSDQSEDPAPGEQQPSSSPADRSDQATGSDQSGDASADRQDSAPAASMADDGQAGKQDQAAAASAQQQEGRETADSARSANGTAEEPAAQQRLLPSSDDAAKLQEGLSGSPETAADVQGDRVDAGRPDAEDQTAGQPLGEQAAEQWLRRIPDDPAGLLRRKFLYQYQRSQAGADEVNPW